MDLHTCTRIAILIALLSCFAGAGNASSMQEVKDLTKMLLDGYNKDVIPMKNQSEEFKIAAIIYLRTLSDLDELQEELRTVMGMYLFWTDESMVWNGTEYENITKVTMDASIMWKPRLAVTNAHFSRQHERNGDWDIIEYLSTGHARWITIKMLETSCEIDTTFYPFDEQRCSIELFIYGYYSAIKFNPIYFEESHLAVYTSQGTWNITDYYISNRNSSNVTLTYHLKRNPKYMVVNFLVPILVLAMLNPVVFLLPADSGERIGYSMTIMLALSVYMTLLGDYLPQNSDPIPLMTYTIMVWYLLSATCLFVLFCSARLHNTSGKKPVPRYVQVFVRVVRMVVCMDCKRHTSTQDDDMDVEETETCLEEQNGISKTHKMNHGNPTKGNQILGLVDCRGCRVRYAPKQKPITWREASRTLDVFFMVFIYLVKAVFALSIMFINTQRPKLERIISEQILNGEA